MLCSTSLQMFDRFIKKFQFQKSESQKKVALHQAGIYVQGSSAILAHGFPLLQLQVAQCSVCEVQRLIWILYLIPSEVERIICQLSFSSFRNAAAFFCDSNSRVCNRN